jgi:hypothetical protein
MEEGIEETEGMFFSGPEFVSNECSGYNHEEAI